MASWESLWKNSIKISICIKLKENCYKVMYRWYSKPKNLANMNGNMFNKCWKCQKHEGPFYHMWTCYKAKEYWSSVHLEISKVLKGNIQKKNPDMFLQGLNMENINDVDRTVLWYMTTVVARLLYAQYWK